MTTLPRNVLPIADADIDLLREAESVTGLSDKFALSHEALSALLEREAIRGLMKRGGSDPTAEAGPRNRR